MNFKSKLNKTQWVNILEKFKTVLTEMESLGLDNRGINYDFYKITDLHDKTWFQTHYTQHTKMSKSLSSLIERLWFFFVLKLDFKLNIFTAKIITYVCFSTVLNRAQNRGSVVEINRERPNYTQDSKPTKSANTITTNISIDIYTHIEIHILIHHQIALQLLASIISLCAATTAATTTCPTCNHS